MAFYPVLGGVTTSAIRGAPGRGPVTKARADVRGATMIVPASVWVNAMSVSRLLAVLVRTAVRRLLRYGRVR